MPSHWECRCGERFGKYGFEFTGHIKDGKGRGEDHGIRGLVDDETGEVLAVSLPQAVKRGLVPSSSKKPRQSSQRRNPLRRITATTRPRARGRDVPPQRCAGSFTPRR